MLKVSVGFNPTKQAQFTDGGRKLMKPKQERDGMEMYLPHRDSHCHTIRSTTSKPEYDFNQRLHSSQTWNCSQFVFSRLLIHNTPCEQVQWRAVEWMFDSPTRLQLCSAALTTCPETGIGKHYGSFPRGENTKPFKNQPKKQWEEQKNIYMLQ